MLQSFLPTIVMILLLPQALWAQPALDRLEKQLRDNPAPLREPGYLGVVMRDVAPPGGYIEIRELLADGPAAKAGLEVGDLIIRVANEPARRMDDLAKILNRSVAGDQLEFTILRGQDEHKLIVTMGKRPPPSERKFEQFGAIQPPATNREQELPAPAARPRENTANKTADAGPLIVPPANPAQGSRSAVESRIDLLERRMAELERRLAELERLLERRP
jgi:hypothetical protein